MTLKDPELLKYGVFIDFCDLQLQRTIRMNCNETAGDRLTVCEQELLQAFVHLVSISSNFLFVIAMVKLQQFAINEADEVHYRSRVAIQQVCHHRLQQASLYLRHIKTSALCQCQCQY